ncbi:VOC family protein [Erythrobacter sp. Alg231-14]|uniref:VOC family protein n=1 Tax=Erythrobacter sp. Alg231-14 TaxID=1922225 RepID=UPI000D5579C2
MPVTGLDHVQIAIPDGGEDSARRFFVDLLGMREVPKPGVLSPKGCWFTSGSANIHVGVDPDFKPACKAHPALLVDELDGMRASLATAGYPVLDDKPIAGIRRFFTEDPFGNRIEIIQN